MRYALGLDIGITSVGWAAVNLDKRMVADLGVRAFNAAENPQDKSPLAEPRRQARSTRRRLRRRSGRLRRSKELFVKFGLIDSSRTEAAFLTVANKADPWQLRAEGLDRLLTGEEFSRALFHIIKRRGFMSNSQRDKTKEDGVMLASISENRQIMQVKGYRTAGEMLFLDEKFSSHKRNKLDSYSNTVDRILLKEEIQALFSAQRSLGSTFASPEFEAELLEVFAWQMPYASGDAIYSKVGQCTFERDEKRAPRSSWTAERFTLLDSLNRLSINVDGVRRRLTPDERKLIEDIAYSRAEVKYSQIRKVLDLPEEARFTNLTYTSRDGKELSCETAVFCKLQGYHGIRKACEAASIWEHVKTDHDLMDDLAHALTFYKTDEDIRDYLSNRGLQDGTIAAALTMPSFSKVGHLSIKAMRNLIPHLEEGKRYDEACAAAGYNHYDPRQEEKSVKLPVIDPDEVRNPVVLRALSQARKVVNAVIGRYGSPYTMYIELARDIGKTADERKRISRRIEQNRSARQEDREHFAETFKREATGEDMAKWRLYREQNGQCAYSQKPLDIDRLFEPGYAEIDHILPYSRSFDDSFSNRVLALASENQRKKNCTPHEYFGDDEERWNSFAGWVRANIQDNKKRTNLLMKDFAKRQEEWRERNLVDTRYISRFFSNFVKRHLLFADPDVKNPVICFNGRVVALARGLWGLNKVREENDLHHALDAVVAAVLTPGRIKAITDYRKAMETGWVSEFVDPETGEVIEMMGRKRFAFPEPWPHFRREVVARLSDDPAAQLAAIGLETYSDPSSIKPVMVSRMPIRKATGALHLETIRSIKYQDGKRMSVIRKRLQDLKKTDLDKLYDPAANETLYTAIRQRMEEYGGDAKKAFAEPFHKPSKEGKLGPVVKRVKVCENQPSGIEVRNGIADNGSLVRADVFAKDGKYYLVPVYAKHLADGELPNRAITANKPEDEWRVMDDSYMFMFSLQPYDLVWFSGKKHNLFGYYRGVDRSVAAVTLSRPNNNVEEVRVSPMSAIAFEKYTVGILGDYHRVTREVRLGMENSRSNKPCKAEG